MGSSAAGRPRQLQDTDYEVPQQLFDEFANRFQQIQAQGENQSEENSSLLQSLGIDPTNWLTDLENQGTEDVEGTDTIRISAKADVPKLAEDLKKIAQHAQTPAGGTPAARSARQLHRRHQIGRSSTSSAAQATTALQDRRKPRADAPGGRPGHLTRSLSGLADDQRRQ
jgi:hypothetical protein